MKFFRIVRYIFLFLLIGFTVLLNCGESYLMQQDIVYSDGLMLIKILLTWLIVPFTLVVSYGSLMSRKLEDSGAVTSVFVSNGIVIFMIAIAFAVRLFYFVVMEEKPQYDPDTPGMALYYEPINPLLSKIKRQNILSEPAPATQLDSGTARGAENTEDKNAPKLSEEKHFWANRQGEIFDSANAPGGIAESLETIVWMAFRGEDPVTENQPAEENAYILESSKVLEGSEEVENNYWIRVVQESFIPEEWEFGQTSHKDYIFYIQGEDAYVGVQSAEDTQLWTILKMTGYGEWLEKEIDIYVRMTTGL